MRNHPAAAGRRWRSHLRILPLLLSVAVGCDTSWGITEAPTPDVIASLSAAPNTAPADGASVVLITAEVDTVAAPTTTEVKFATSLGTFPGGAAVTVPIDADGKARVQLKAPGETGTAIVSATAGGRTRTLTVSFTTPVNGFTALTASSPTAPADGASTTLITAQVDLAAVPSVKEVKFATSLGSFLGGSASATIPVDASGIARIQLRAPAETGTAIISATAGGATRTITVSFTTPVNGFTALTASPSAASADGASTTLVTAQVDLAAVPSVKEVKFATTLGTFPGGSVSATVPVDATGTARVQLRAPADSGTAIVSATAGGVTRTIVVPFVLAPPTRLELVAEKFVLPAGLANSVKLTATPLRTVGSPSPGTLVTFSADTVGGHGGGFGQFSAQSVLVVHSGSATTQFSAGETTYRGPVIIRATATLAGQSVSDSTIVTITNPPS